MICPRMSENSTSVVQYKVFKDEVYYKAIKIATNGKYLFVYFCALC